jgi:hypothetical protein
VDLSYDRLLMNECPLFRGRNLRPNGVFKRKNLPGFDDLLFLKAFACFNGT